MSLIIFILVAYGLTNAIVYESVFAWLRNFIEKWFPYSMLNDLINCPTCTGFWVGILLALLFPIGIHWFILGLISSAANKLINTILFKF